MTPEPFKDADDVAEHLKIQRRQVLQLARANSIPGYPICLGRSRRMWRFKLSEVDAAVAGLRSKFGLQSCKTDPTIIVSGSPHSRKEQSHG